VTVPRYLKRRRQGWYFQIAVPVALRKAAGKATITKSLRTRDLNVAQERYVAELLKATEAFRELAGGRQAGAASWRAAFILNHRLAAISPGELSGSPRFGARAYPRALKVTV
jgi:hypothetical protein